MGCRRANHVSAVGSSLSLAESRSNSVSDSIGGDSHRFSSHGDSSLRNSRESGLHSSLASSMPGSMQGSSVRLSNNAPTSISEVRSAREPQTGGRRSALLKQHLCLPASPLTSARACLFAPPTAGVGRRDARSRGAAHGGNVEVSFQRVPSRSHAGVWDTHGVDFQIVRSDTRHAAVTGKRLCRGREANGRGIVSSPCKRLPSHQGPAGQCPARLVDPFLPAKHR